MSRLSDIGDYRLVEQDEPEEIEPTEEEFEQAFDSLIEQDDEAVYAWEGWFDDVPSFSSTFPEWPISGLGMMRRGLSVDCTPEQALGIFREMRQRLRDSLLERIEEDAMKLAERRIEAEGVAQQERWAQDRFEARFA